MKLRRKNKLFPQLNVINGKSDPYGRKGVLRYYYYISDPKLGPDIVEIRKLHTFTMLIQQYYLFPGIIQLKEHIIIQYTEDYIIAKISNY